MWKPSAEMNWSTIEFSDPPKLSCLFWRCPLLFALCTLYKLGVACINLESKFKIFRPNACKRKTQLLCKIGHLCLADIWNYLLISSYPLSSINLSAIFAIRCGLQISNIFCTSHTGCDKMGNTRRIAGTGSSLSSSCTGLSFLPVSFASVHHLTSLAQIRSKCFHCGTC